MTTPVITVEASTRLTTAAAILARHNVKGAPVVDAEGGLQGIVSRKDLLSVYLRADSELAAECLARDRGIGSTASTKGPEVNDERPR